jgi:two-component system cell cycle response regulator DivK
MGNNNFTTDNITNRPDWSGYSILIVEDDFFSFKLLEGWAFKLKVNVLRAENGQQAVDMCLEHEDVDIVLMDLQLPGMDGYDATRIIKQRRPDLPIILVTANAIEDERKKSEEAGCDEFITKPIDIKQLTKIIGKFLSRA